ncbi:MAG: aldo/keto reductase [Alphaproteobacteria bacterium]|nr:aldo/keto reductase [Alphaproteobacteria bacterium]
MEQRTLGKSGLLVSVVGLGCNNFGGRTDFEGSKKVIHKAFDLGITLLDTADIYANKGGSEEVIGKVLGDRRKDIVLATKFCGAMDDAGKLKGASRRYIMTAVEASLRRLQTDWIDLYQIHMPDPLTPMEETLRALDDLVTSGKVRYIGCSNHKAWQVTEAEWISRRDGIDRFISCQDEYSLIVRDAEKELIPAMQAYGIGLLPYFPLAGGMLTGKYKRNAPMPEKSRLSYMQPLADRYMTDANWQVVEKLEAFASPRGKTMLELAFSWLACRPTVASVIAGATKPEQLEQNAKAASWVLTPAEMAEIDKLSGR